MTTALVLGAGGFIGHHLVWRLVAEGFYVRGVDVRYPAYSPTPAHDFVLADLRDWAACARVMDAGGGRGFDEVYQLAADMGGADYVFSGDHDFAIVTNNTRINQNLALTCARIVPGRIFFASSACVYPRGCQNDPGAIDCREDAAYPADPDSAYGWEKLFAERMFAALAQEAGVPVRVGRYHNIMGPECAWNDGREKAPAALCRKVARTPDGGTIELYGDGEQRRSFLDIDEALEGTCRLMRSAVSEPLNIGSDEMVRIADLAKMIAGAAGKRVRLALDPGKPTGVRARTSDNARIFDRLGWRPHRPLHEGLARLYPWVAEQVAVTDTAGRAA